MKSGEIEVGVVGMLMGEFQHKIDAKGRLFMPAKLREGLGSDFIITKGLDKCLSVYSQTEWEKLLAKFAAAPKSKQSVRQVSRFLFGNACQAEVDKQGRILLPAALREHAGLNKEVVIVGVGTTAEIWDSEAWHDYNAEVSKDVTDIVEQLVDLGI
ncbi:MAG: division/cell wall cluster transcriptional repressor MraZ [Acidaminococcaceae bacterium]|nr:division/cell wall cluster transcriptional repressor MraZ [Acidaminococcaceae bacterium]